MTEKFDKNKAVENILAHSGGKINKADVKKAADKGDFSGLISGLSDEDKKKLNNALSNKDALNSLLSRPDIKALMKGFMNGGTKNG